MRLVRVKASSFTAGFETDGVVRRCAPILRKALLGKTDDEARQIIAQKGWKASVIAEEDEPWIRGHELLTVRNRRWCLGCDLLQQRGKNDWPAIKADCPRDTVRARHADADASNIKGTADEGS